MPIIDLQKRFRQLGEIRIGHTVDTGRVSTKTGKAIKRPAKLNKFRLTSASKPILEQAVELFGGEVTPWTPANGGPDEWQLYTDSDRLPIVIPPKNAVSQWYEQYKGSKCVRRCDGETEFKSDKPCFCANREVRDCSITTRINVMLRDLQGVGVWLLTTHGYYAATELPDVAEFLSRAGGYVDAWLSMEEKSVVRADGKTARFMVPKLDVGLSPAQLLAGEGAIQIGAPSRPRQVAGGAAAAIESGEEPRADAGQITAIGGLLRRAGMYASDAEQFVSGAVGRPVASSQQLTVTEAAEVIKALESLPSPEQVWAALGDEAPADWSIAEMEQAFARDHGGTTAPSASVAQIQAWGELLVGGEVEHMAVPELSPEAAAADAAWLAGQDGAA